MPKGNVVKFIEGAFAGLALGIAAGMFLNSKKGKELQKDAKDAIGDFYKSVAPKIKKMKKMGQGEYKAFMKDAAEKFGKAKKLSEEKIKELVDVAQKSWNHLTK